MCQTQPIIWPVRYRAGARVAVSYGTFRKDMAMEAALHDFLTLHQFPTGRRLYALREVRHAAVEMGFGELVHHIDKAMAHDRETRELELRHTGRASGHRRSSAAQKIDLLVDETLVGLRDLAVAQTRGARPGDPIHGQVDELLRRIFPSGLFALTAMPYMDELAAVDDIVVKLRGPLAEISANLGMARLTERLGMLADEYRTALSHDSDEVELGKVRAARVKGQAHLLEAVALVLGAYYQSSDSDHASARTALLRPIIEQNQSIEAYVRAHRPVRDIDPDSGELDEGDESASSS